MLGATRSNSTKSSLPVEGFLEFKRTSLKQTNPGNCHVDRSRAVLMGADQSDLICQAQIGL